MARPKKYPDELIERGVRLALESGRPVAHVAADLGMHPETLREKVRQAQADSGERPDLPTSAEREEIRALRREVFELRRANEILKSASRSSSTQTGRGEPLSRSPLSVAFPATAKAVPRPRHCVDGFVRAHADDAELRGRIRLAFTQAFSNAVTHAYAR
jgi:transposase